MKRIIYFLALFLFINILNSCTPDESVEDGVQYELEENIIEGQEDTPLDKDKSGR